MLFRTSAATNTLPLPLPLRMLQKPDGGLTVLKRTSPILRALQNPTAASLYYLHFQSAVHACACHKIRRRPKGTTCTFRLQAPAVCNERGHACARIKTRERPLTVGLPACWLATKPAGRLRHLQRVDCCMAADSRSPPNPTVASNNRAATAGMHQMRPRLCSRQNPTAAFDTTAS